MGLLMGRSTLLSKGRREGRAKSRSAPAPRAGGPSRPPGAGANFGKARDSNSRRPSLSKTFRRIPPPEKTCGTASTTTSDSKRKAQPEACRRSPPVPRHVGNACQTSRPRVRAHRDASGFPCHSGKGGTVSNSGCASKRKAVTVLNCRRFRCLPKVPALRRGTSGFYCPRPKGPLRPAQLDPPSRLRKRGSFARIAPNCAWLHEKSPLGATQEGETRWCVILIRFRPDACQRSRLHVGAHRGRTHACRNPFLRCRRVPCPSAHAVGMRIRLASPRKPTRPHDP